MTINQLQTLTEDELCLALYVVNQLSPAVAPPPPYDPDHLTWWKHTALVQKMLDVFPKLKPEAHTIYASLMEKMGVKVEIKPVLSPEPPPIYNPSSDPVKTHDVSGEANNQNSSGSL